MGKPKALVRDARGFWLQRAVSALLSGGCDAVTVVLGARAAEAARNVPTGVEVVVAPDWSEGMSRSLSAGLSALRTTEARAVMVHLVDLPDVTPDVVRRVAAGGDDPAALRRAAYRGVPGHPVLLGSDHWQPILDRLDGDEGARAYLRSASPTHVECGDLATGIDEDMPPAGSESAPSRDRRRC